MGKSIDNVGIVALKVGVNSKWVFESRAEVVIHRGNVATNQKPFILMVDPQPQICSAMNNLALNVLQATVSKSSSSPVACS